MNKQGDCPSWQPFGGSLPETVALLASDGPMLYAQGLSSQIYGSAIATPDWQPFGLAAGSVGQSLQATADGLYVIGERRLLQLSQKDGPWRATASFPYGVIGQAFPEQGRVVVLIKPDAGVPGAWEWRGLSRTWQPMAGAPPAAALDGRATTEGIDAFFLDGHGLHRLPTGTDRWEPVADEADAESIPAPAGPDRRERAIRPALRR